MQEINKVMNTNLINNALIDISSSYRYNVSNNIEYPFGEYIQSESDSLVTIKEYSINEWLLSTYTKRFMILISYESRGNNSTPLFTAIANCAISGNYQHTIVQTNGTWGNWSYIVFDFTPNETKNSISVTDANGVPTKGLFTLQLVDSNSKIVTAFTDRYRMHFIMVGSGVEGMSLLSPRESIPDTHIDFLNNLQTGKMIGYTRTKTQHNSFQLETGESYPTNRFTARNFVIPTQPFNANVTDNYYSINFNAEASSPVIKSLSRLGQKILMLSSERSSSDTIQFYNNNGRSSSTDFTTMNSIRNPNYKLWLYNYNEKFHTVFNGTTGKFPFNNLLVVEPSFNAIKEFTPANHPLVLPQTSTSLTGVTNYKIYDYLLSNYFANFREMYFNTSISNLTLMLSYNYIIGGGMYSVSMPKYYGYKPTFYDYNPNANIVIEGFNSDTNHNIYCSLGF